MAKATKGEGKQKGGKSAKAAKPNFFARLVQYFRDVRVEMKRVVWPGRQEVINSSVVVVVTLIFFVAFTFIVDTVSVQFLKLLSQIGS